MNIDISVNTVFTVPVPSILENKPFEKKKKHSLNQL